MAVCLELPTFGKLATLFSFGVAIFEQKKNAKNAKFFPFLSLHSLRSLRLDKFFRQLAPSHSVLMYSAAAPTKIINPTPATMVREVGPEETG